jgi:acyl-coenzyme A thioesterase PaaI-like protein
MICRSLRERKAIFMSEPRTPIPKPQGHHCFACGTDNPFGLDLQFYTAGDAVCADVILDRYRVGWEGIAHGGIISTLMDEIMSWTIIYFRRVFFLTRKMEVRYLKPVPIEAPLTVQGKLGKESPFPRILVQADVLAEDGTRLAYSRGEFVELSEDKLALIPDHLKADMESLFERFSDLQVRSGETSRG